MSECVDPRFITARLMEIPSARSNQLEDLVEHAMKDCACPLCVYEIKGVQVYDAEDPDLVIREPDENDLLPEELQSAASETVESGEPDPRGLVVTCESLPMAYHRGRVVMSDRVPILMN